MSERVRRSSSPRVDDNGPVRHVWVLATADRSPERRPGLLIEWRHTDEDEWLARVAYSVQLRPGEWGTLEEWVPSALVHPA